MLNYILPLSHRLTVLPSHFPDSSIPPSQPNPTIGMTAYVFGKSGDNHANPIS